MFKHDIWLAVAIVAVFVFVISPLVNMIDKVISCGASSSLKGIHMAACDGDIDTVRLHLDQGIDVNIRDEFGKTPLYWAADRGKKNVVEMLIANGADVNIKNKYEQTPLNAAAIRGAKTITEILVANGAAMELPAAALLGDIDFFEEYMRQNSIANVINGENLLHLATSFGGHKPIVQLLIERGIEVNAKENFLGWTPLHFAASSGYLSAAETLLANRAQVNVKAKDFTTPLHLAVARGRADLTQLLIENGADIHAMSNGGTPLYRAAEAGYTETAQLLIVSGADVNLGDRSGMTPLQRAAANGNTSVAELLIVNGANLNARFGFLGWTPLYFANSLDTIELLKQHGALSRMYWWAEFLESLGILRVGE
ncbi:Ankyrin (plasmid) [Oscillatoria nigro-viridis PCC 7112]|uniref:Ankyrin n=1 Tax=Phormidium nigroviride PCC 7112 TaxID=179408 RepID=K9VS16_9CYAN|nr:ankyrin repeat domain-containing protein [Oscillatoria nigro-viridis]AFZ10868.1 Ankyrin [Oscillatoria nigro-viridis PCC 7112]